jgi:hypothetical protein
MGKCESVNAYLGIKILLSELIKQINETNFDLIKEMLEYGLVEDEDEYLNDSYQEIIYENIKYNTIKDLFNSDWDDKYLLIRIKDILEGNRFGYEREGVNSISRPIDFDLLVDTEKYKDIKNFQIVFILMQASG